MDLAAAAVAAMGAAVVLAVAAAAVTGEAAAMAVHLPAGMAGEVVATAVAAVPPLQSLCTLQAWARLLPSTVLTGAALLLLRMVSHHRSPFLQLIAVPDHRQHILMPASHVLC